MATEEEKKNQQDLNESKREEISLEQELIRILAQRQGISSETLSDQQDVSNVLKDQIKQFDFQNTQKLLLRNITNDINKIAAKNYAISLNELGTSKNLKQLTADQSALEKGITLLTQQQNELKKSGARLDSDIAISLQDQVDSSIKLKKDLEDIQKTSKEINKNFSVKSFSALEDITKSIPGLNKFSDSFTKAADASRLAAATNKISGDQRKILDEKVKGDQQRVDKLQKIAQSGGKGIKKGALKEFGFGDLSGTAASAKAKSLQTGASGDLSKSMGALKALPKAISPLIAGLKLLATTMKAAMKAFVIAEFVMAIIQGDKATGDLAKSMNITYKEANRLRGELNTIANLSGDNFVTTKGLQETLTAINGTLGTNVMLNEENLVAFTKLREVAGLTNNELMGVQSIVNATGGDLKDATGEILAQARISSARLGVALNEKEVLKSIKDVSAATTLSLGKNPGLIADAAATAKSLGMELGKVDQIASSLLQFESSIEAELEAELLLGKNINLEKARSAALNNDLATVAKEIAKEAGTAAEFGEMNRIQQEAIAKSVGMNRDDLAKTLFVQEQLLNVSGKDAELRERNLNTLIEEKGLAEAQRQLADKGIEGLEQQASIGERFNQSMEKLKEIFVTMSPAILTILDVFSSIFSVVGFILKPLGALMSWANSFGDIMGTVVGLMVAAAAAAIMFGSSVTLGLGIAAIVAGSLVGLALLNSATEPKKVGDMFSPAIGKTMVSTKEGGLFELSDNDDVIAAPGLASKGMSGGNNSSLIAEIRALRSSLESRPINVNTTVELDGEKIGSSKNVIRGLGNNSTELGTELSTNSSNLQ